MRVPLTWLAEYCDPQLDVHAVEERLTMTGTKVEAIHHHGVGDVERFVIGRVLACERHPDADRLSVCTVDLGGASEDGPAKIVCGAPNVAAGQTVAVALPGATMPDGTEIGRARLRGIVSEGMILAEQELAIGPGGDGILVLDEVSLDAELAPGTPLAELLAIATDVLELEITPNRPDCLGDLRGRARAARRDRRAAGAGAVARGRRLARPPARRAGDRRVRRRLPALHGARVRERHDRAVAAVAEGAAAAPPGSGRSTTSSTSPTTRCC